MDSPIAAFADLKSNQARRKLFPDDVTMIQASQMAPIAFACSQKAQGNGRIKALLLCSSGSCGTERRASVAMLAPPIHILTKSMRDQHPDRMWG